MSHTPSQTRPSLHEVSSDAAFGRAAPMFDADERANILARWARRRSLAALDVAFKPGSFVLEIGCGTGIEALHLAGRGVRIVATDAAEGMLEVLRAKLASGPKELSERITPMVLPASRAGELVGLYGSGAFDGAYSSMGALNCEPTLHTVAASLAQLVRPRGKVVLTLINRYSLWETAWYLRARQPGLAFRRWRGQASATSRPDWQEERFTCYYWNLSEIRRAFQPHFRVAVLEGLPWLLPPLYLSHLVSRAPRFFRILARLDRKLARVWPAYLIGDQVLIEMVRDRI